jgi:tetratricopeptide (TPR) repeat protein
MNCRAVSRVIFLMSAAAVTAVLCRPASAREAIVPMFGGIVYADGRPIERAIGVRLEAEDRSLISTTATIGSGRFIFRALELDIDANYYLIINESGFKDLRYRVVAGYFLPDSASPGIAHSSGLVMLDIESLPPEKKARRGGPVAVDTRQLTAEVSTEARREYHLALKDGAEGKSKEMVAHLEKALDLAPEYYDALNRLGSEYIRTGQLEKARTILERAEALNPNDPIPLTNLGILQFQQGERLAEAGGDNAAEAGPFYRNAMEFFEKALRLNPLDPRVNVYLGITCYRLGFYEKSEALLTNALALDGRLQEARLTLISLYHRLHRYADALKQIEEYLQANPDAPQRMQLEQLRTQIQEASTQP